MNTIRRTWKGAVAVSERLTMPDYREINDDGSVTTRRTMIDGEKVREHAWELYKRLKQYEDACFDDPNEEKSIEAISLARLRELAEAEREGRIEVKTNDNKHDVRVCSNCQSIVHYDPYFKRYLCRTCGQESYLPQAAKEMMEAARALDEPKGEATT